MSGTRSNGVVIGLLAAGLVLAARPVSAQGDPLAAFFSDLPTEPRALADAIIEDVAEIRGLEFRAGIDVLQQSPEEFGEYLDSQMDRSLPPERAAVFGRVVNKLGLYRGPVIEDVGELLRMVMTTQAGAYYDPDSSAFYVLLEDLPPMMLGTLYAHELYHGLQDQHFDLDAYMLDGVEAGLNDDEMMARQAVVEGEATYVMTLWMMREMTGQVPRGLALDLAVQMQAQLDTASMRELLETGAVPSDSLGEGLAASMAAMDQIPPFILESLVGAYLKGMAFVHQAVRSGWDNAERFYSDPPRSTEQILHPEKWLEGENPVAIDLPDPADEPALEDWALLDSNVIGEIQWRIIFSEFEMGARSTAAAAGWDGDRYAVLGRDDDELLLLYTTWDSDAEAEEFAVAYTELLGVKYPDGNEPTRVDVRGSDVLIVEGGDAASLDDYLDVLSRATLTPL